MPCLYAVGLDAIRPAAIHLPSRCRLHLQGLEEADFSHAQWDTVVDQVCTFNFEDHELKIADCLPNFLGVLLNIQTVVAAFDQLGTPQAYLDLEPLCHVPRLYLGGTKLYLRVPARVAWEEVNLETSGELGLSFNDLGWFAKNVPIASFRYAHLEGPSMLHLISAWTTSVRPWSTQVVSRRTVIQSPPDCRMIDNYMCFCEVCIDCLEDT